MKNYTTEELEEIRDNGNPFKILFLIVWASVMLAWDYFVLGLVQILRFVLSLMVKFLLWVRSLLVKYGSSQDNQ